MGTKRPAAALSLFFPSCAFFTFYAGRDRLQNFVDANFACQDRPALKSKTANSFRLTQTGN